MVAPIRRVLDLSHHNSVTNLQTVKDAGIWGIIHKATEGTSFKDSKYDGRKAGFLELGFLWGAYHFFHPGRVAAQVDWFLKVAGVDDQTLYALDWEESSSGTASASQAEEFCRRLEDKTGRKGVIYSGNVAKEKISGVNTYLGAYRLWLAQYDSNPETQASWQTYWLWQYSDGVHGPQPRGCPGVSGYVDTNSWASTFDELHAQWSGMPEPIPPADMPEVSMTNQVPTARRPIRQRLKKRTAGTSARPRRRHRRGLDDARRHATRIVAPKRQGP
jgi:GH25 family lysozyme M1 (1,4-beta-N-acetylmuramidase)